ncbi:MAG TPA: sulfite oxidase [Amaricoccus sp.]|uniref:sulfite oxidase n=1 Tax=Amaricoccus sp. TaxID=1872485 RepID=UPI002C71984B|nr:sulfite oxidase [Amaricoccus sp.]HPG23343.1 sulfite oxidase [Amaricoccus sp.]HRW13623.1 sulfite oxidase [Amaricoccus sp.]
MTSNRSTDELRRLLAEDPAAADLALFGRVSHADRRGFLRGAGLAAMSTAVGMAIPYHRNIPQGFIPAAMAQGDPLAGKLGLVLLSDRPVNAETPPELLDDDITPTDRHFIRNNGVPPEDMNPETWTLTIDGFVDTPLELSIADLRDQFEVVSLALTLECGGNGRAFFDPPASGNQWTWGAVGCAEWTGVRLREVLDKAGVQANVVYTGHHGADTHLSGDPGKEPISRGMPIGKAMTDNILIAFAMNGADLHPMNGAPLRLVVPGWPGSCSQKWLTRIELRDRVHDGEKMGGDSYRVPAHPVAPGTEVPEEEFEIIERMPVKSVITFPANGAAPVTETEVRGHAWSGDRTIEAVDISTDFGATWMAAEVDPPLNDGAWQNWRASVVFPMPGYYEVWARARDSEGVMQPFAIDWNPKGYLNNSMHRVGLQVA